jgi:hypothetical protein
MRIQTFMRISIIVILLFIGNYIKCQTKDRFIDGTYMSPLLSIQNLIYKFYGDTFETYKACVIGCLTTKGLYEIIDSTIYFYPIDPENLQKSVIYYSKGKEHKNKRANEFYIFIKCENDTLTETSYWIWLRDSLDNPIMTLISNGSIIHICNFSYPQINKIKVGSVGLDKEEVTLPFDRDFIGEHSYSIILANDSMHFVKEDNYSLRIIKRSEIGFTISDIYCPIEFRLEKYVTDDFIYSRIRNCEEETPAERDLRIEMEEIRK